MSDVLMERLWNGPTLILDSATAIVHAGILTDGRWTALETPPGEALETVFRAVEIALQASRLELAEIQNVALGIGPGSILGLRIALMALRTWQRLSALKHWQLYQFSGLQLHARQLAALRPDDRFHLVTDFRRGTWHHLAVDHGHVGELELLDEAALLAQSEKTYYIPTGRGTQRTPHGAQRKTFSLSSLPSLRPLPWATPTREPELYLPAPPSFKIWTAQIHRRDTQTNTG